jgi:DNA polymerase-1
MSPLYKVYQADKRAAAICTAMSQRGFAFDVPRSLQMASYLRGRETAALQRAEKAIGRPLKLGKGGGISTNDLQVAFFRDLRAPIYFRSELTGKPSLNVDAMKGYAACAREELRELAVALLQHRSARMTRAVFIEGVKVSPYGRVHPSWLNYGTVSGRFAAQDPNLMNLPKRQVDPTSAEFPGGIRSLYGAAPGYQMLTFDCKQAEMRIAAFASGDPAMMAACAGGDLHDNNATLVFGEAFSSLPPGPARKEIRDMSKNFGFAVAYLAEAETVYARIIAQGGTVKLRAVEAAIRKLRSAFHHYFQWQADRLLLCIRLGYVESPILGRRRWLGHDPLATEAANFPIQSGAADVMNERLPLICDRITQESPMSGLVAQVHDSGNFEVRERDMDRCEAIIRDVMANEIAIASSGEVLRLVMPIDVERSVRWH